MRMKTRRKEERKIKRKSRKSTISTKQLAQLVFGEIKELLENLC